MIPNPLRNNDDFNREETAFTKKLASSSPRVQELFSYEYDENEHMPFLFETVQENNKEISKGNRDAECQDAVLEKVRVCKPIHNKDGNICLKRYAAIDFDEKTDEEIYRYLHDTANSYRECSNMRQKIKNCPVKYKSQDEEEQLLKEKGHRDRIVVERSYANRCMSDMNTYKRLIQFKHKQQAYQRAVTREKQEIELQEQQKKDKKTEKKMEAERARLVLEYQKNKQESMIRKQKEAEENNQRRMEEKKLYYIERDKLEREKEREKAERRQKQMEEEERKQSSAYLLQQQCIEIESLLHHFVSCCKNMLRDIVQYNERPVQVYIDQAISSYDKMVNSEIAVYHKIKELNHIVCELVYVVPSERIDEISDAIDIAPLIPKTLQKIKDELLPMYHIEIDSIRQILGFLQSQLYEECNTKINQLEEIIQPLRTSIEEIFDKYGMEFIDIPKPLDEIKSFMSKDEYRALLTLYIAYVQKKTDYDEEKKRVVSFCKSRMMGDDKGAAVPAQDGTRLRNKRSMKKKWTKNHVSKQKK